MKVCVYCSSSSKIDKIYFEATEKLAKEFIKENVQVVYGGGGNGRYKQQFFIKKIKDN